ncbi:MAG TPA: hypothetical protein VMG12_10590 [Polyangiaceae bacterium]|nr:hypothetical protein [Polyangiaceae bacterium]
MSAVRWAVASALFCHASRALAAEPIPAPPVAPSPVAPSPVAPSPVAPPPAGVPAPAPVDPHLESARRLGAEGLAAFDEHAYSLAIERLTSALEFHDAPTLRMYRARAFGKLGRWIAACEDYDAILRSRAAEGESSVVAQARGAAEEEGTDACARIAKLRLVDVASDAVEVRLDGTPWPRPQQERVRYVDPGPHGLERVDPRAGTLRRVLSLAAGEALTVSLRSLEPVAHGSVDADRLRFLVERPRRASGGLERDDASDIATSPGGADADAAPPLDTFRLELAPLGTMYNDVDVSEPSLNRYGDDSTSLVARLALALFPLPERWRDYLGVGATWVQDLGTGRFSYTKSVARIMSRQSFGRWRFGASVGAGYQESGVDLLVQRLSLIEPALEAGVRLGELSVTAAGSVALPLGYSETTLYTDLSGYGVEGRVAFDYRLWRWLGVQLSLGWSRFDFDFEAPDVNFRLDGAPLPRSANVVNQYTSAYLGVSMSL